MSTGRRPKRSESVPRRGENRNCIRLQTVTKSPNTSAARAVSPVKPLMRFGRTGMMMPKPRVSRTIVT
jgi:hypothetical protein